jgi:hypothetical protein
MSNASSQSFPASDDFYKYKNGAEKCKGKFEFFKDGNLKLLFIHQTGNLVWCIGRY